MNLTKLFVFVLLATLLAVVVPLVDACEPSCRKGVATAIAKAYEPEDDAFWEKFQGNCLDNWSKNINIPSALVTKVNENIKTEMAAFQKELDDQFATIAFNSIFTQKPKFMGSCDHPTLVTQPKTMPWPRDTCEKQTYICGNPPAVCHFLNKIVKPRVFSNINKEYKKRDDKYLSRLQSTVNDACTAVGLSGDECKNIARKARGNLVGSAVQASRDFPTMFCANGSCDKYDESLRLEILSWP